MSQRQPILIPATAIALAAILAACGDDARQAGDTVGDAAAKGTTPSGIHTYDRTPEATPRKPLPKLSPAAANRIRGQQFLADNAKKPGVVVTASGLQYVVIQEGTGASPKLSEAASLHFRGSLIDGKEFDSSRGPDGKDRPVPLPLGQIIRGLSEGLQLARVGGIYDFYIPSQLAYGLEHAPELIGPNQCLIFHIEMLGIEQPRAAPR